jgi:hypothetical protein
MYPERAVRRRFNAIYAQVTTFSEPRDSAGVRIPLYA